MSEPYLLTDLPNEILENVLSYMSYDEIAKNRVVCRQFDTTCKILLNHGFLSMERRHSTILKKVKSQLPRRESERRIHSLARHSDILIAIETRISMLRMTFMKYVEKNVCCFIPGKVIDEILRVLKIVDRSESPPRTHEILQELRDISSMAMEHFDEKIAPNLKINPFAPVVQITKGPSLLNLPIQDIFANNTFRKDFNIFQQQVVTQKKQISYLKELVKKMCSKLKLQNNVINVQTNKLREQVAKINQQDSSIAELKRHVEEWDTKFQDLVQNLNRSRDETPIPSCSTTGALNLKSPIATVGAATPIMYKPNIKPRKAQILSRSLSNIDLTPCYDYEQRKRKLPVNSTSVPAKTSRLQIISDDEEENKELKIYRYTDASLLKLPSFLSSGIETLLKSPISSIKSRKRKL